MKHTRTLAILAIFFLAALIFLPNLHVQAKSLGMHLRMPYWTGIGTGPSPESLGAKLVAPVWGTYGYRGIPGSTTCSPCQQSRCNTCTRPSIYKPAPYRGGCSTGCGPTRLPFKVDLNPTKSDYRCSYGNACGSPCGLRSVSGLSLMGPFRPCANQNPFARQRIQPKARPLSPGVPARMPTVPYVSNVPLSPPGIPSP